MRRAKSSIAILAASLLLLSASVGAVSANDSRVFVDVVPLSGANEVCGQTQVCGDPDGRGVAVVVIFPARDLVCWAISWRNIEPPTLAHIHGPAPAGQFTGVVVDFTASIRHGCVVDDTADAIVADPDLYYVNVHTSAFPAGAIRGQLD